MGSSETQMGVLVLAIPYVDRNVEHGVVMLKKVMENLLKPLVFQCLLSRQSPLWVVSKQLRHQIQACF